MKYGIVVQYDDETGNVASVAGDHIGNIRNAGNVPTRCFSDYVESLEGEIRDLKILLLEKNKIIANAIAEMKVTCDLLRRIEKGIGG